MRAEAVELDYQLHVALSAQAARREKIAAHHDYAAQLEAQRTDILDAWNTMLSAQYSCSRSLRVAGDRLQHAGACFGVERTRRSELRGLVRSLAGSLADLDSQLEE